MESHRNIVLSESVFGLFSSFPKTEQNRKILHLKETCNRTSFNPSKRDRQISLRSQIGSFVSVTRNNEGHLVSISNCKEFQKKVEFDRPGESSPE